MAVYAHFNRFIDLTINSLTNPYNLPFQWAVVSRGAFWFRHPVRQFRKQEWGVQKTKTYELENDDLESNDLENDDLESNDLENDDLENDDLENDDLENDDLENDDLENDDLENDDLENEDLENDDLKKKPAGRGGA